VHLVRREAVPELAAARADAAPFEEHRRAGRGGHPGRDGVHGQRHLGLHRLARAALAARGQQELWEGKTLAAYAAGS
jgi:hypothetical protein